MIVVTLVLGLLSFILFYNFWFLRDPKITIPKGNVVISPASGTVLKIVNLSNDKIKIKKGLFGKITTFTKEITKKGYLITIVMTPFDVHYQKSPIDGIVTKVNYSKGKFKNAVFGAESMNATLENEKNEITVKGRIKLKVIQIAGAIARRIVCFVKPGDKIRRGQNIGLIKLGSQVCLIVPEIKLMINEGQKVNAGETIIGELK